jgi:hypothetical protein
MSDSMEIAKNIGIIASIVGFVGTAIKVGHWKGGHDARLVRLEDILDKTVEKLSKVDDRVDGIERELLETMTALRKDIEYIKRALDDEKEERRRNASEK